MTEEISTTETDKHNDEHDRPALKIQDKLPIRSVGLETKREQKNFSDKPPQNYIHVWFARRPTPATRLGVLSSVLPDTVDDDTLLKWMGMNPDNLKEGVTIAEHVRNKTDTLEERSGRVYDHYGYRKAYKNLPDEEEMQKLHQQVRDTWGGELPTVLDATAGGGSIPFESGRYNLPTVANELNPVPSVILKAVLEHPRVNGDLSGDIKKWGEKINEYAREKLSDYYPEITGHRDLEYIWMHQITCPDCGSEVPLTLNWWLEQTSSGEGYAVQPQVKEGSSEVELPLVELPKDVSKDEFNPTSGTVSRAKAECPACDVTIEEEEIKEQGRNQGLETRLVAVHYESQRKGEGKKYRAATEEDLEAVENAREKAEKDPEIATLLTEEIPDGKETSRTNNYGIEQWRDMYNDRQLVTHYTYWQAFEEVKAAIWDGNENSAVLDEDETLPAYSSEEAEVILTFLALGADKAVDYNSRMCTWVHSEGKIGHVFAQHDFGFAWKFAESRLPAEGLGYEWVLNSMVEVYEELEDLAGHANAPIEVYQEDAANLPLDDEEVEAIVLDPPYYDNVMYAELSDYFYVWLRRYLGDVYPDFFQQELTEKNEEAVANPAKFDNVAGEKSKSELAKDDYENKMSAIFDELERVLDEQGVFTLMFTHKKTEAWDTLTKALINAGFIVKSTHPISTERPESLHQRGKNSAESTILLSAEKRQTREGDFTLWEDIKAKTQDVAKARAKEMDQDEVEFSKVDIMLAAFGPTLEVFTENYPVVDGKGNEVEPQEALDEAREAVREYLVEKYLNKGIKKVDPKTEWYVLAWLIFEAQRFPYDEARRLAIGMGESLDDLKRPHRMWRKKSGDILLRPHEDRVQNINKNPDNRSSRKPVDPEAVTFSLTLDKVHAAMHVYDVKGATEAWNWMKTRDCASDPEFKATIEALLWVLPEDNDDREILRNMVAGETGEYLDLNLDSGLFTDAEGDETTQSTLTDVDD
jgi:adenine-specific DNA methylase